MDVKNSFQTNILQIACVGNVDAGRASDVLDI